MYKIIGADGKGYGPISAEQLRQWIAQGRANAQTQTLAEGASEWKPLGALPEFIQFFPALHPPQIAPRQFRKTNGYAITGLILGILSFICCFKLLFGALGIIFSAIGLSHINRNPELYDGRGIAIAGLVLSIVGILIGVGLILFWLASGSFHYNWNFDQFRQ